MYCTQCGAQLEEKANFCGKCGARASVMPWVHTRPLRTRQELIADLKELISQKFPEYEVECEVAAVRLDPAAHPKCTPIQFLFSKNKQPILAVVIVKDNNYRGRNVKETQLICEKRGITYVRFFEEQPNHEEYVVTRIKKFL